MSEPARVKSIYVGAPKCFALELALRQIDDAFGLYGMTGGGGLYLVGSALERPDWAIAKGRALLASKKGGDMAEWPDDLRVREFPEVRA